VKHVIKNLNFPKVVRQHISGALVDLMPSENVTVKELTLLQICESYEA